MDSRDIARGIIGGFIKAAGAIVVIVVSVMVIFYVIIRLMVTFQ